MERIQIVIGEHAFTDGDPMPHESQNFYWLDDKLFYVCKDFIGFNPVISKALTHEILKGRFGTKITVDEFDMPGSLFNVILINFMGSGPLRGYKGVEILKEGKTIIRYKKGGGLGGVYGEGNYFLINKDNAYMLADGQTLQANNMDKIFKDIAGGSYYFFWFTDIIIPTAEEIIINYDSLPDKESYTLHEMKHLRQIEWHANAMINNHEIALSKSFIPGFRRLHRNSPGCEKFCKDKTGDMSETKNVIDGVTQLNENQNGN